MACAVAGAQYGAPRSITESLISPEKYGFPCMPPAWREGFKRIIDAFQTPDHPAQTTLSVENAGGYREVTLMIPDAVWEKFINQSNQSHES